LICENSARAATYLFFGADVLAFELALLVTNVFFLNVEQLELVLEFLELQIEVFLSLSILLGLVRIWLAVHFHLNGDYTDLT
jgi:hypothetical protein